MSDYYLTKSDFKVAQTCPTKLYYRKMGYPTLDDGDEYLAMLADQGYLVEALARALFPNGRHIGFQLDVEAAAWDTMDALTDPCTLFEATFISRGKLARVDILVRRGNLFELIEIKSCAFNRAKNDALVAAGQPNLFHAARPPHALRRDWRPIIEDAAFQTAVVQDVFPDARVVSYLLMPDNGQPCTIDGLPHLFTRRAANPIDASRHMVTYTGDPRPLRRHPFLTRVDVSVEVATVLPDVRRRADEYAASLMPSLSRITTPLSTHCLGCEYRVTDGPHRGFHDCWGELAGVSPHILDLYHVREAGGGEPLADQLIARGRAGLLDVPERRLTRRDGGIGQHARRQRIQIVHTRANREWQSDELNNILATFTYPLHFLDFETCAPAIPRYAGMRPFETLAYQWSCCTVAAPDAQPLADDWLQTIDAYPHVEFAAALRRCLGEQGTILVWSAHEATVLANVRRQLISRGADGELVAWLGRVLESGQLIDLHQLAEQHYFHPMQGGRTSLKAVAEAVWHANPSLRVRLPQYVREDNGALLSPYAALPPLSIGGREVTVAEGKGAILAYFTLMERTAAGATLEADRWRALLRQYCALDALAMVLIWRHWRRE